jgi:hypothetical protein
VTQAAGSQQASIDKDVVGMDHSKLNHGVLGSAAATSDAPTAAAAPTTWNSPGK